MTFLDMVWLAVEPYIAEIIIAILIAVFNKQIRKAIKLGFAYATDKPIRMTLLFTEKFNSPPKKLIDGLMYDSLVQASASDTISRISLAPHLLRLHSQSLGMQVSISLDEELQTTLLESAGQALVAGTYLNVKADAEIRGIRRVDDTLDFVIIATKASQSIGLNSFAGVKPERSYVVCDIQNFLGKPRTWEYYDKQFAAKISLHDGVMTIIAEEPVNLPRVIKRYVWKFI
jgi:hypothetical protein